MTKVKGWRGRVNASICTDWLFGHKVVQVFKIPKSQLSPSSSSIKEVLTRRQFGAHSLAFEAGST